MIYISKRHGAHRFIAFYHDYSTTYGEVSQLEQLYRPALAAPEVVGLAVSTRPDCLPPEVLDLLQRTAAVKDLWVEIGLQIADDSILAELNRCHTVADFTDAVAACGDRQLPVCVHVILGLPGVTAKTEARTADLLAELGVWGVKVHAFHVLAGTKMARRYRRGELTLLSRAEYSERVVAFVRRLRPGTVIHRLTAEAPRRLTVAPLWTVNKLAVFDAVMAAFGSQGAKRKKEED